MSNNALALSKSNFVNLSFSFNFFNSASRKLVKDFCAFILFSVFFNASSKASYKLDISKAASIGSR